VSVAEAEPSVFETWGLGFRTVSPDSGYTVPRDENRGSVSSNSARLPAFVAAALLLVVNPYLTTAS
jgi:hypothetical protein